MLRAKSSGAAEIPLYDFLVLCNHGNSNHMPIQHSLVVTMVTATVKNLILLSMLIFGQILEYPFPMIMMFPPPYFYRYFVNRHTDAPSESSNPTQQRWGEV